MAGEERATECKERVKDSFQYSVTDERYAYVVPEPYHYFSTRHVVQGIADTVLPIADTLSPKTEEEFVNLFRVVGFHAHAQSLTGMVTDNIVFTAPPLEPSLRTENNDKKK